MFITKAMIFKHLVANPTRQIMQLWELNSFLLFFPKFTQVAFAISLFKLNIGQMLFIPRHNLFMLHSTKISY